MARKKVAPIAKPDLKPIPWYEHKSSVEYLAEVFFELGMRGLDIHTFYPLLSEPILDIQQANASWEHEVVNILDFRLWDIQLLRDRNPKIAKPRMDIYVELTTHGNLSVKWKPTGKDVFGDIIEHDFRGWGRDEYLNDFKPTARRPNNELLYIRNLRSLVKGSLYEEPWKMALHRRTLYAARALLNRIVAFLRVFCEVRVITDFEFILDKDGQMAEWSIENTAHRWMSSFEQEYGMKPEAFLQKMFQCKYEGIVDLEKFGRVLRKEGYPGMTLKVLREVKKAFQEYMGWPHMDRHYPEVFNVWVEQGNSREAIQTEP